MGLDISVATDNYDAVYSPEYYNEEYDYRHKHNLSRTFCNFMCKRGMANHEPELDQIGKLTGVDIKPFYDMEYHLVGEGLDFFLEMAETEEERNSILQEAEEQKNRINGNIDLVNDTVANLISKLMTIENLPALLLETDFDSLDNESYFSDFETDKGDGYIDNNFGQDLRNFKRFLEFAKSKNTTTVWFVYG